MSRTLERLTTGRDAVGLRTVLAPITCHEARLLDADTFPPRLTAPIDTRCDLARGRFCYGYGVPPSLPPRTTPPDATDARHPCCAWRCGPPRAVVRRWDTGGATVAEEEGAGGWSPPSSSAACGVTLPLPPPAPQASHAGPVHPRGGQARRPPAG